MTLDEWISRFDNEEADELSQEEQLEIKSMLIELNERRVADLKTGDSAEIIEYADKLGTYCRGKDCEECPFHDEYNDCILELERPGMWDLEYLLKGDEDDDS